MEYVMQLALGGVILAVVKGLSFPRLDNGLALVLGLLLGVLCAFGAPVALLGVPVCAMALLAVWPLRAALVLGFGLIGMLTMGWPDVVWMSTDGALLMAALALVLVMILMAYNWRWWSPGLQLAWGLGTPALLLAMAEVAENGHVPAAALVAVVPVGAALAERMKWRKKARKL